MMHATEGRGLAAWSARELFATASSPATPPDVRRLARGVLAARLHAASCKRRAASREPLEGRSPATTTIPRPWVWEERRRALLARLEGQLLRAGRHEESTSLPPGEGLRNGRSPLLFLNQGTLERNR